MEMMRSNDDEEDGASISLRDINVPRKEGGDWERVSSVTINDITNPYYRSLLAIHNRVEHSYSNCSSVSDDETSQRSLGESRNLESLAGEESCLRSPPKGNSFSKIESELDQDRTEVCDNWMPSWKHGMLEALREYDASEQSNLVEDEFMVSKLNQAIDSGLKIVDQEQKRLLRRQSARLSAFSERKSLLTIDEVIDESQPGEDIDRRISRGLSILESDRSTLLVFKRTLSFDGNNAEYFSWRNDSTNSCLQAGAYEGDKRALLEEARKSLKGGVDEEYEVYDTSHYFRSGEDDAEGTERQTSALDNYKELISFCFDNSSYDEDKSIFLSSEEGSS